MNALRDVVFYNNFIISCSNNKMEMSTKYALLGKKLFDKCKTSQATSDEIKERLKHLRMWNQDEVEWEDEFSHKPISDKRYINKLLAPINLDIPFDTPATESEILHFAEVCGLTRDTVDITDLFTYDWRANATEYIDPSTGIQYLKVPKGAVIYHGMDIKYPFDKTRIPKYFATVPTAYSYAFVSLKNNRTAEEGKVVPFRLKEDILVLNITSLENWKILMPTEENVPEDVLREADESFNYKPNSGRSKIGRDSTTKGDNIVYEYILSLPQTSIAAAAGSRGGFEEIVFTDISKLEKVGYELPYEIVMVNDLTKSEGGIQCAFAIEARATADDPSFKLVATLSQQEFREKLGFSTEAGKTTFEGLTEEQIKMLRQKCLERALGNFEITVIKKPKKKYYSSSDEEEPVVRRRVAHKSVKKKPVNRYSSDEESD